MPKAGQKIKNSPLIWGLFFLALKYYLSYFGLFARVKLSPALEQNFPGLTVLLEHYCRNRAYLNALLGGKRAHALRAEFRVNNISRGALGYGPVRALRLAGSARYALVSNLNDHSSPFIDWIIASYLIISYLLKKQKLSVLAHYYPDSSLFHYLCPL
jgi:hypothetical protein